MPTSSATTPLGFVLTAAYDKQDTRQDRLQSQWLPVSLPIADLLSTTGRTATDVSSGKGIRILNPGETTDDLVGWDPNTQVAVEGPLDVLAMNYTDISTTANARERFSVTGGSNGSLMT